MKYRKKGIYQKITNKQRINLLRMVLLPNLGSSRKGSG